MGRFTDRLTRKRKGPRAQAVHDALNEALIAGDDLTAEGRTDEGNCYEVAALAVLHLAAIEPDAAEDIRLVHGRPTLAVQPYEPYGHAWIEIRNSQTRHMAEDDFTLCADVANGRNVRMSRLEYYGRGRINRHECFYYTPEEAQRMMVEYGHYGPWEGPEGCAPVTQDEDEDG